MFFALVFGIGLLLVNTPAAQRLQDAIQGLFDVTMRLIGIVIRMAPLAIACFMFNLAAVFGWELLVRLSAYVGVVLLALGLHMFVTYPLALKLLGGEVADRASSARSRRRWWSPSRPPRPTPRCRPRCGSPRTISSCRRGCRASCSPSAPPPTRTAPRSSRASPSCSSPSSSACSSICRQQVTVLLICILGGIGTAGVPAGSLPVVALILAMVGVPAEGIGLVLGVDRFLDMCRTTLNVTGDLAAAVVVSRGEEHAPAMPAPEPGAGAAEAHPS